VVLKNNQKHLREDLIKQVDKPALGEYVWQQRKHAVSCQLRVWEVSSSKWSHLTRLIRVRRVSKRGSHTTDYISNQCLSPEDYAAYIQGHREIENNLHWVKDVLFLEDKCRLKKPSQALVMGILRSMAVNLLRLSGIDSCTEGFMFMQAQFQHPWLLLQTF
jgi:predicted transposase YbfD/YdcC